ncbi:MAG: hypothetical protein AAB772_02615 [Patescibacteria group bacterium]
MFSKEQRENILESTPNRLSDEEISELVKKYPVLKLDEGKQHFIVEVKNDLGEVVKNIFIPTWGKIPKKDGAAIPIEEELKNNLSVEEKGEG